MSEDLVRYIEQNRYTYTREAIDKQLIVAGHSSEQIAAAWAEAEARRAGQAGPPAAPPAGEDAGAAAPPRSQRVASSPLFWAILVGFVVLSYALPGLVFYLAVNDSTVGGELSTLSCAIFGVLQVAALIVGVVSLNANRARAFGLLIGTAVATVVIPVTGGAILFGLCLTSLYPV